MNLDDLDFIHQHDPEDMLGEIDNLPAQLETAWETGLRQSSEGLTPAKGFTRVLIAGMGGSAIGGDLLSAYVTGSCRVPVIVHRDYGLPAWSRGPETLVIASSHSGNTEETLDSFEAALKNKCRLLAVCTGGELEKRAVAAGIPVWKFEHKGQPRAAVGFSFGLLLSAFTQLGVIANPREGLHNAVAGMRAQQEILHAAVPVAKNPAKRMAGQLVGRWVNIYGSGLLAPVARRWKGQLNELAKAGAGFEFLPEADHNALAGAQNPTEILTRTFTLFLSSPSDHLRNRLRTNRTRKAMMVEGFNTDLYQAQGSSPMTHMWTALHFGDYVAFYLAMAYGVDPSNTTALEEFKAGMKTTEA